jgi:hypothetical protein
LLVRPVGTGPDLHLFLAKDILSHGKRGKKNGTGYVQHYRWSRCRW